MSSRRWIFLPFFLVATSRSGWGLRTGRRSLKSTQPWAFVQRFCFRGSKGGGRRELRWKAASPGVYMLLFLENNFDDFSKIHDSDYTKQTMQERFSKAVKAVWIGDNSTGRVWTEQKGVFQYNGSTTRWFYVVFANFDDECSAFCNDRYACKHEYLQRCFGNVRVDYELHVRNNGPRQFREFSWDDSGLLILYSILTALFVVLMITVVVMVGLLMAHDKLHPTPRIFVWAVLGNMTATSIALAHYAAFRNDGRGMPKLLSTAHFGYFLSDGVILFVLLLCANGWNIVRRKLQCADRIRITVFAATYCCGMLIAFIWHIVSYDPVTFIYIYDTGPGYLLLTLRLVGSVWIVGACVVTHAHFRAKQDFYFSLGIVAVQWASSVPFTVFVSALVSDTHRRKVAYTLEPSLSYLTQAALTILFLPAPILNVRFPFHSSATRTKVRIFVKAWNLSPRRNSNPEAADLTSNAATTAALPGRKNVNFASVSGGRSRDIDARGKCVIKDGFEALHLIRIRQLQAALESRIGRLRTLATDFNMALQQCAYTSEIQPKLLRTPKAPFPHKRRVHQLSPPVIVDSHSQPSSLSDHTQATGLKSPIRSSFEVGMHSWSKSKLKTDATESWLQRGEDEQNAPLRPQNSEKDVAMPCLSSSQNHGADDVRKECLGPHALGSQLLSRPSCECGESGLGNPRIPQRSILRVDGHTDLQMQVPRSRASDAPSQEALECGENGDDRDSMSLHRPCYKGTPSR